MKIFLLLTFRPEWGYEQTYTGVIPHVIKHGKNSFIVAKSPVSGTLFTDLYSRDGKNKLKTLSEGPIKGDGDGMKGFKMIKWNGIDPDRKITFKGDYLVRWTLNGNYS